MRRWGARPLAAGLAAAAASTLTTALAGAAAGREADLALNPVEFAVRVGLLLGAPCLAGLLAAVAVPHGDRVAGIAVALGVPVGPLIVLRLDRLFHFGALATTLTIAVLLAWALVGSALALGWWARPIRAAQRAELAATESLYFDRPRPGPASDQPRPGPPP